MKYGRIIGCLLAVLLCSTGTRSFAEDLFTYDKSAEVVSKRSHSAVIGRSLVKLNMAAIKHDFTVTLPSGKKLHARLGNERRSSLKSGSNTRSFRGELHHEAGIKSSTPGNFSIVVTKGADGKDGVSGTFLSPTGEEYILKQASGDNLEIVAIDSTKQLECQGAAHSAKNFSLSQAASERLASDIGISDESIRLLVAYTPDAIEEAGSESALLAQIQEMVDNANLAHQNSQTGATYTLVGTYALSERSSDDFAEELSEATDLTDGKWDELSTLKQQYCADEISVIVGGTNGETICGIAWLGGNASTMQFYSDQMFSIVTANKEICSYLTFAHELGHNLGSDHDFPNSGQAAAYNYSYGHRFFGNSAQQYRTVMAYAPGTRIPYFSNPDVNYDGASTGVAGSANNALSISQTWSAVADFVAEGDSCSTSTNPGNGGGGGGGSGGIPASVTLALSEKVSTSGKTKFKATQGAFDEDGLPVSGVTLNLYFDTKANGAFTKFVGGGVTGEDGLNKSSKSLKKTGNLISCYYIEGSDSYICSSPKKVKVTPRRRRR